VPYLARAASHSGGSEEPADYNKGIYSNLSAFRQQAEGTADKPGKQCGHPHRGGSQYSKNVQVQRYAILKNTGSHTGRSFLIVEDYRISFGFWKGGPVALAEKSVLICPITGSICKQDDCAWYLANDLVQGCAVQHIAMFLAGIQTNTQVRK